MPRALWSGAISFGLVAALEASLGEAVAKRRKAPKSRAKAPKSRTKAKARRKA